MENVLKRYDNLVYQFFGRQKKKKLGKDNIKTIMDKLFNSVSDGDSGEQVHLLVRILQGPQGNVPASVEVVIESSPKGVSGPFSTALEQGLDQTDLWNAARDVRPLRVFLHYFVGFSVSSA